MSLKVWLPLNGDLHNQGTSNYTISVFRGTETYDNNGKIGKCFYAHGTNTLKILNILPDIYNYSAYSLCAWCYIEAQNTSHTGSGIISGGNWNGQLLNLAMSNWSSDHYTKLRISGSNWNRTYDYNFYKNTWYHIVVCDDGLHTYGYVNGNLIGNTAASFLPTSIEGTDICIGGATYYTGMQFFGKINDVRIYDHCLSAAEVREISQGLVLHYKLDSFQGGYGNKNLLARYVVPGQAAPTSTANGGRTTWLGDYKITILARENADTYFRLFMTEQLTSGTTYTISCKVSGLLNGSYYRFPLFSQSNTSMGVLNLDHNGLCSLTFTMNWTGTQTAVTGANGETVYVNFLDDSARAIASGQGAITLYDFKLEKGSSATAWCPSDASLTQIQDSSGYNHNASLNMITTLNPDTARYSAATYFGTYNNPVATLNNPNTLLPALSNCTITWWGKYDTTKTLLLTGHTTSHFLAASNNNTYYHGSAGTITFYKDGVAGTYKCAADGWHFFAMTGVNISSWTALKLNGYSSSWPLNGYISDLRIYCTALSLDDILSLYHTAAKADNLGELHTFEFQEIGPNKIYKTGITQCQEISEINGMSKLKYDRNIYIEPDGSAWVRVFHHMNPASNKFASSDTFTTGVYKDENRWFDFNLCNYIDKWEFIAAVTRTSTDTLERYRWIQSVNPFTATFEQTKVANITRITTGYNTSTLGGLYHVSNNTWFAANNGVNNNWFGATGCWSAWNGGIPGWKTINASDAITTGTIDIYIRIDNLNNELSTITKITENNIILAKQMIER